MVTFAAVSPFSHQRLQSCRLFQTSKEFFFQWERVEEKERKQDRRKEASKQASKQASEQGGSEGTKGGMKAGRVKETKRAREYKKN